MTQPPSLSCDVTAAAGTTAGGAAPSPTEATPLSSRGLNSSSSSSSSSSTSPRPPPLSPTYHALRRRLRVGLLLCLVGLIVWAAVDFFAGPRVIESGLKRFLAWVGRHPYAGAAAFLVVYAGCTVVFIPGALLTLGGSFLFGHALGPGKGFVFAFVAVYAGACLGAMAAFLLGRFLLHADAQRLLQRYPTMLAIDRALHPHTGGGAPLKIMTLLRLSPLVPFAPLNYLMSITSLSLRDYTLGLGGMVPATLAYVFLGTTSGSLAAESGGSVASNNKHDDKTLRIVLYALGAASLVLAVGLLSAHARRELRRLAPETEAEAGAEAEDAAAVEGDGIEEGRRV